MRSEADPSWGEYPNTVLEISYDRARLRVDLREQLQRAQVDALRGLWPGGRFAVITPCNPRGSPVSEHANRARVDDLAARLVREGIPSCRADGVSPDGAHREPGFAVPLELDAAVGLAAEFEQSALFYFDGERFLLVPVLMSGLAIPLPRA